MLAQTVQSKLLTITALLVILMIAVQVFILGSVGTMGPNISAANDAIAQTQLDNELKLAKIRELQTNNQILVSAYSELDLKAMGISIVVADNLASAE